LSPFTLILVGDKEVSGGCDIEAFGAFTGLCSGTEERIEESPAWLVEVEYVHLLLILGSEDTSRVFIQGETLLCRKVPGSEYGFDSCNDSRVKGRLSRWGPGYLPRRSHPSVDSRGLLNYNNCKITFTYGKIQYIVTWFINDQVLFLRILWSFSCET